MSRGLSPEALLRLADECRGEFGAQSAFAKRVGIDKSHVSRLKQMGLLVFDAAGQVDFEASLRRIAENADPARQAQRRVAAGGKADASGSAQDDEDPKYASSRASKEYWAARTAKVEYERLVGQLVYRADVDKAVADVVLQFRQAVENQPHRLADRLVGLDLAAIRARLRDDGQEILAELVRAFSRRLQEEA